ncbi:MAG: hypothetical protein RL738_140 [Bacteroidota bacterium]
MNTIKSDSLFLGLAVLLSLLFVSGLGGASVMALLGYQGMTLAEVVLRQELNAARALLAQQGLGSLALFLIPGLALQQRWARSEPATPSLPQRPWGLTQTVLAWSWIPALLPALTWLSSAWYGWLQGQAWAAASLAQNELQAQWVERMLALPHWGDKLVAVLVFVLVAAAGEELFFRGALQRMLRARAGALASVGLSAVIFSGFHFDLLHLPFLAVAGLVLAYLYERSGRLWVPMGAHLIHNGITYVQTQLEGPGSYAADAAVAFTWWVPVGILAALAVGLALRRE